MVSERIVKHSLQVTSLASPPVDKSKTGGSSELKRSSRKLPTCSLHLSFYLVFFLSLSLRKAEGVSW